MSSKSKLSIVIPGLIGNILEWYDFALYGCFAPILSPLFFPSNDKLVSLMTAFAVFAIGFIMRPIGALFFGLMGDKYGRKKSLSIAILLMAISTSIIGCLPSYASIGILAPLLLLLMRLLQGLAVGGESTGAMVYIIEHVDKNKRGFYSSIIVSNAVIGILAGSLMALFVDNYHAVYPNLWRMAFLLSFILGFVGLYLRLGMPESPAYMKLKEDDKINSNPVKTVLKTYPLKILLGFLVVMLPAAGFYLCFVYMESYLHTLIKIPLHDALLINSAAMFFSLLVLPLAGFISDKVGIYKVQLTAAICFILLSVPLFYLINTNVYHLVMLAEIIFAVLVSLSFCSIPIFLVNLFPADVRYTGLSLSYNLSFAIIGGTIPLISTALIHYTNNYYTPAFYLCLLSFISLIGLYYNKARSYAS